jgi:hypothetical protein
MSDVREVNNTTKKTEDNTGRTGQTNLLQPPMISLPKGGGSIRGIGEKFAVNPVTGTASLSVPIFTSPGRSGFGPQLSLSYDSGAGNGPFGFGWSLSLPSITRKTDKGLPLYRDKDESDTFIFPVQKTLYPVSHDTDVIHLRRLGITLSWPPVARASGSVTLLRNCEYVELVRHSGAA